MILALINSINFKTRKGLFVRYSFITSLVPVHTHRRWREEKQNILQN